MCVYIKFIWHTKRNSAIIENPETLSCDVYKVLSVWYYYCYCCMISVFKLIGITKRYVYEFSIVVVFFILFSLSLSFVSSTFTLLPLRLPSLSHARKALHCKI